MKNRLKLFIILKFLVCYSRQQTINILTREQKTVGAHSITFGILACHTPVLHRMYKAYIWNAVCQPILLHGSDCMLLGKLGKEKLETSQANLLKQCLGLSKRCHLTKLLRALNVKSIADVFAQHPVNLLRRVFNVHSPVQSLFTYFISCMVVSNGTVIPGILVECYNVVSHQLSVPSILTRGLKKPRLSLE